MKAAQWITEQGGYAFRMGAVKLPPLPEDNPMIIDYANKHRTDFMDIYLGAKAKFFLGAGCGLAQLATVFGVPNAVANYPMLEYTTPLRKGDLYIPKLIWWRDAPDGPRLLQFDEWLESGAGRLERAEQYDEHGLEVRDNTEDEILELCQEMYQKLEGTWQPEPEDEELQRRYKAITQDDRFYCAGVEAGIATTFLRRHEGLLDG
jgi:putative glycosyltransferase (TIGR04372 family)